MPGVIIHSYDGRRWEGAQVVGLGHDTLMNERATLIVRHPDFGYDLDFFAQPDQFGRHFNVGNMAFWVTVVE